MRVRPFFWILLAVSCIGVLVFAATKQTHVPAVMQVNTTSTTGSVAVSVDPDDAQEPA